MRDLHLTSPYMHGEDVMNFQKALNVQLKHEHRSEIKVDGQYGPNTANAVSRVAYTLGLLSRDGRQAVQRSIEHPLLRTPTDMARAKKRAEDAKEANQGLAGVIEHAKLYIGVEERPAGSNRGAPYPDHWEENFGMDGVSWCGCFAGSMVLNAGGHVNSRVAYVPYIIADAKAKLNGFIEFIPWNGTLSQVKPGWLVTFDWTGAHANGEHVGIVTEIVSGGCKTIEGNTGGSNPSDGGMVAAETRQNEFIIGYAEPHFT